MTVTRSLVHHAEGGFDESVELEAISELIPDVQSVLWLDVQDPTQGDLEMLRKEFGFHELALEDVVRHHQRAKLDQYGDYCFIVFYAARRRGCQEINLFVGKNYLVTLHQGEIPEISETVERWRGNADRIEHSVALPLYSLLDAVVDGYFPVIDEISEEVELLEDQIFDQRPRVSLADLFGLKKELLGLRRVLAPERDVLNVLIRRDEPILGEHTLVYFQDVYDHTVRVLDSIDLYREQLTGLLEAHLSVVSNRLNIVMKKMTALATVLMTTALVAGIYGMNFHLTPSEDWEGGFWFAMGAMTFLGAVLAAWFRRIGWL